MTYVSRGRHFEDFTVGETFMTAARTVTEGAVDLFAGLSGDFNPLHTDEESARQGPMALLGMDRSGGRLPCGSATPSAPCSRSRRRGETVCQAEWTTLMARRR